VAFTFWDINQTLKGRFHNEFANVLMDLGEIENQQMAQQNSLKAV
jgi:hypothetical protein